MHGISTLVKRHPVSQHLLPCEDTMRNLTSKKTLTQSCCHPDHVLQASITVRKINFFCSSYPICGILLWQPQHGEGNGTPFQYSCLENPMDGGAWWATVHGVAKSWTQLSDFTFTSHFHALEKEMATHSSVLAWRIPGTEEPGRRLSMGSHRVRHD